VTHRRSTVATFVLDHSLLLLLGTAAGMVWANLDFATYDTVTGPLHFWVNEIGMMFFFALAAKEVFEATLPGGPLASPRRALAPLAAAVGGMVAPAAIFVSLALTLGPTDLARGWAIPCATDIAFSAMIARLIFPAGHPALPFLLLLAIADDALGLLLLAVFYPSAAVSLTWLVFLMAATMLLAVVLRRRRIEAFGLMLSVRVRCPGPPCTLADFIPRSHSCRLCRSCHTAHEISDCSALTKCGSPIR
jgi:Na+:H+ antiporter, NhaA family